MLLQDLLKLLHRSVVVEIVEMVEGDGIQGVGWPELKLRRSGSSLSVKVRTRQQQESEERCFPNWYAYGQTVRDPLWGGLISDFT